MLQESGGKAKTESEKLQRSANSMMILEYFLSFSSLIRNKIVILTQNIYLNKTTDMAKNPSLDGLKTGFSFTKPQSVEKTQDKVTVKSPNTSTPSPRGHA